MSRSVKKNPIVKDSGRSKKEDRTLANRAIRRKLSDPEFDIGCGNEYRKHTERWNIYDYVSRWSLEEALIQFRDPTPGFLGYRWQDDYKNEEEFIKDWKKAMLRK